MGSYSSLIGSFVLLGVLKYQAIKSLSSDKSVVTLQQIMKRSSPVTSSSSLRNGNREAMSLNTVIIKDMSNALNVVTSDSKQKNQLIPKLFNINNPNPTYVFSLPQGARHNFLTMHRNNFNPPIFPNLTFSYIHLMRKKGQISEYTNQNNKNELFTQNSLEDRVNENLVEKEDVPTLNLQTERNFIDFLIKVNQLDKQKKDNEVLDEWSLLGLNGWQGILSKEHVQEKLYVNDTRPKLEIWDLPGKMQEQNNISNPINDNTFKEIADNLKQRSKYPITSPHSLHSDSDVYIARVNDPFGHSTKWNEKNLSSSLRTLMEERKKRGVIELYSMIKCSTGCDPIVFKGYGCYCGFLGDGIPVDGIDRCCRLHDTCYEYSNCIPYIEYFVPYIWKCYRGKPLCAIDHGEWGGPNSCAARLCQCDLRLSRCLRRFLCPHRRALCRTSKTRMLQNILLNF